MSKITKSVMLSVLTLQVLAAPMTAKAGLLQEQLANLAQNTSIDLALQETKVLEDDIALNEKQLKQALTRLKIIEDRASKGDFPLYLRDATKTYVVAAMTGAGLVVGGAAVSEKVRRALLFPQGRYAGTAFTTFLAAIAAMPALGLVHNTIGDDMRYAEKIRQMSARDVNLVSSEYDHLARTVADLTAEIAQEKARIAELKGKP